MKCSKKTANLFKNTHSHSFVLTGMAGAGKSTVGPLLAEALHYDFVDSDDLIAESHAADLQQILDRVGQAAFQILEEEALLSINLERHVIATGGSAVYSGAGMSHLKEIATIIWLDVPLPELEARVNNMDSRGLVNPAGISFADLYRQRLKLYQQYADLRIDCSTGEPGDIVARIVSRIRS